MHEFLTNNRAELIARCKLKVACRLRRAATDQQLANGVPLFIDQLIRTLEAEEADEPALMVKISGTSGGGSTALSEIGVSATAHGRQLLELGYTVDQVVHDYGDLCQAITELAFERDAPFEISEFRTLNRCLDNAIAEAVTEFSAQRDSDVARQHDRDANQRLGFLVHELRNSLATATYAFRALELSNMTVTGATGAVLKRSLTGLRSLIGRSLDEVRGAAQQRQTFPLAGFIADAESAAQLDAAAVGCRLTVAEVDPALLLSANRETLGAALANLLQNAFKFTHANTEVTLTAYAAGDRIHIVVEDHCGGLPPGSADKMFKPFHQRSGDRTGLGLGLVISRQSVEAEHGSLNVRDLPGSGCAFTIDLPRPPLQ